MLRRAVLFVAKLAGALLLCLLALFGLGRWALDPYPSPPTHAAWTGLRLMQVPFADRVVIGDSRVNSLNSAGGVLFLGYNGATTAHLERFAGVVCALTDKPVVIALGINDAVFRTDDIEGSIARLGRMADGCAPSAVTLAQAWPGEADVPPLGHLPDAAAFARMNEGIVEVAAGRGLDLIEAPNLPAGSTFDGIHFMPEVSDSYAAALSGR